jgi:hypothetical protein
VFSLSSFITLIFWLIVDIEEGSWSLHDLMTDGRICSVEHVPDVRRCFRSFDCLLSAPVVLKHYILRIHDFRAIDAPSLRQTMIAITESHSKVESRQGR